MMFYPLLRKEIRENIRTHRLLIFGAVMVILGMISPLGAKYLPLLLRGLPGVPAGMENLFSEPSITDAYVQYVKNISQIGLLLVIILNMGALAQEVERGTAAILLTFPVLRGSMILAKWLGALLVLLLGMLLAALSFCFYTYVLFGPFSLADFLGVTALISLFLVFYLTLAILVSSMTKTQAAAALGTFGGLILVLVLDSFPWIGDYLPAELLTWATTLASGLPFPAWTALGVTCSLTLIMLLAAVLIFNRREI